MSYFEGYPKGVLDLQQELFLNPEIRTWLIAECSDVVKLDTCLGVLAARMGITLDGTYDIATLSGELAKELKRRREQRITDTSELLRKIEPTTPFDIVSGQVDTKIILPTEASLPPLH